MGMKMDCETVKEQTIDTATRADSDEKKDKDENALGSENGREVSSAHVPMVDSPVSMDGLESVLSELEDSDEMEIGVDEDPAVNDTDDPHIENSAANNNAASVANNTENSVANDNVSSVVREKNFLKFTRSVSRLANEDPFMGFEDSNSVANAHQDSTPTKNNIVASTESQEPLLDTDNVKEEALESEEAEESSELSELSESSAEPSDNSNSEMEQWEEADDESDTTEVAPNSDEFLNEETEVDLNSFNFLACPDKVRQRILFFTLVKNTKIKPYYNFGALELPAHAATKENYAPIVVALAGNQDLVDQATTILYSENAFHLRHAKIALWWLKRIGSNIRKLKHLVITVNQGVADMAFLTRREKIWRDVFYLLHDNHDQLYGLHVSLGHWGVGTCTEDGLNVDSPDVYGPRYALLRTLFKFRGLERAIIIAGPFVLDHCADVLERALRMAPGETDDGILEIEKEIEKEMEPLKRKKYSFA